MFGDIIQPTHLLLILVVALLVLGPKRLPEVGRSLGRGLMSFRQGLQGVQDEARGVFHDALDEPSTPPEDSAVSTVPEPLAPAAAEPLVAASAAAEPTRASVTKVMPLEPEPPEFAD
ncbi:MAG: Sec-independent protein translocase subunit TatA/TatB [Solirubrobacteraceae bacterium]